MNFTSAILALSMTASLSLITFKAHAAAPKIEDHSCMRLESDCLAAGYVKGDHKAKKGLYADCMQPLMNGQMPAGITASPDDIAACKAKRDAMHK
jgi:hypothetical protein